MNTYLKLFISVAVCLAIGGISGYLTANEIPTWYTTLKNPASIHRTGYLVRSGQHCMF
jgi:hypothetical protein